MSEAAASSPSGGRVDGFALRGPARLLSDERLARRAAGGDERAFEEIFRRYHQDLYRFCLATVSNPQDAQEALQNTMVKVMRALPGERREIKLKPWLYRIARNEAVETVRRRRESVELDSTQLAAPWEIAETAIARERLRLLFSDLSELPERQRSALTMRELAGFDFAEIGEAFGTTPAVARQTLYEARQSLHQMEEGREMDCEPVRQALSDADGRITRRRDVRAHLRGCAGCRAFRDGIAERHADFAAIAPLPLAVSAGLLQGLIGGQASAAATSASAAGATGAGGFAGTIGTGAGKVIATSALVKSAATVAVVATVGVTVADRGGVIDLPVGGGENAPAERGKQPAAGSATDRYGGAPPREPSSVKAQADGSQPAGMHPGTNATSGSGRVAKEGNGSATNAAETPPGTGVNQAGGHSQGNSAGGPQGNSTGGEKAEGSGRPQEMPAASNHGQQAASTHKPPQAASAPGQGGALAGQAATPGKPEALPKSEGAPVAPPAPKAAPPASPPEAKNGASGNGASGSAGERAAHAPRP